MAKTQFSVGSPPPTISWTVVKGDTASFRVYVTDDARQPLDIPAWEIAMDIKRENTIIVSLTPTSNIEDAPGTFTVDLTAEQSRILNSGDLFDIQLSDLTRVWTIARGSMVMIQDVTL